MTNKITNMHVVSDNKSLLHTNQFTAQPIGTVEDIDGKKWRVINNTQMMVVTYEPVED